MGSPLQHSQRSDDLGPRPINPRPIYSSLLCSQLRECVTEERNREIIGVDLTKDTTLTNKYMYIINLIHLFPWSYYFSTMSLQYYYFIILLFINNIISFCCFHWSNIYKSVDVVLYSMFFALVNAQIQFPETVTIIERMAVMKDGRLLLKSKGEMRIWSGNGKPRLS